jgi:hypothetical protein
VAETEEVPEEAAVEDKFGATEDRAGDPRLAVRRHRERKKRAQVNGGPRQKFAAFRGRVTRRAVPALLKGYVRKGPRRNRHSGVRGPGKKFCRGLNGQSKAFWNGQRGMIGKQHRRLERRRTFYEAVELTLGPKVINLVVTVNSNSFETDNVN